MRLEFEAQQPVSVTLLRSPVSPSSGVARILSSSGREMTIACDLAAPVGTAVEVRWSRFLILGEVSALHESNRTMVLQIRHALNTDELQTIRGKWV
jgi:hypothetical protein